MSDLDNQPVTVHRLKEVQDQNNGLNFTRPHHDNSKSQRESLFKRVRRAARRLGARVDWDRYGGSLEVSVISPAGKVWKGNEEHSLTITTPTYDKAIVHEAVLDLIDSIDEGLIDCPGQDGAMFGDGEYCYHCKEEECDE